MPPPAPAPPIAGPPHTAPISTRFSPDEWAGALKNPSSAMSEQKIALRRASEVETVISAAPRFPENVPEAPSFDQAKPDETSGQRERPPALPHPEEFDEWYSKKGSTRYNRRATPPSRPPRRRRPTIQERPSQDIEPRADPGPGEGSRNELDLSEDEWYTPQDKYGARDLMPPPWIRRASESKQTPDNTDSLPRPVRLRSADLSTSKPSQAKPSHAPVTWLACCEGLFWVAWLATACKALGSSELSLAWVGKLGCSMYDRLSAHTNL
jgi:hypothetical protein